MIAPWVQSREKSATSQWWSWPLSLGSMTKIPGRGIPAHASQSRATECHVVTVVQVAEEDDAQVRPLLALLGDERLDERELPLIPAAPSRARRRDGVRVGGDDEDRGLAAAEDRPDDPALRGHPQRRLH